MEYQVLTGRQKPGKAACILDIIQKLGLKGEEVGIFSEAPAPAPAPRSIEEDDYKSQGSKLCHS
jgi:hypothetical protein